MCSYLFLSSLINNTNHPFDDCTVGNTVEGQSLRSVDTYTDLVISRNEAYVKHPGGYNIPLGLKLTSSEPHCAAIWCFIYRIELKHTTEKVPN